MTIKLWFWKSSKGGGGGGDPGSGRECRPFHRVLVGGVGRWPLLAWVGSEMTPGRVADDPVRGEQCGR